MLSYYKKSIPLTIGVFLSIFCVISLIEFIKAIDFSDLGYALDYLHYLFLAVITGFTGLPLVFYGVEKLQKQ
jgi:hypothetical protein